MSNGWRYWLLIVTLASGSGRQTTASRQPRPTLAAAHKSPEVAQFTNNSALPVMAKCRRGARPG